MTETRAVGRWLPEGMHRLHGDEGPDRVNSCLPATGV
jgi:hypothetical protein